MKNAIDIIIADTLEAYNVTLQTGDISKWNDYKNSYSVRVLRLTAIAETVQDLKSIILMNDTVLTLDQNIGARFK